MKARFRNYSIEQNLDDWITPLVENRVLGFTSKAQVMNYALRKLVDDYLAWGIHPWSSRKQQDPRISTAVAAAVVVSVLAGTLFVASPSLTGAVTSYLNVPLIYEEYAPFIDFFLLLAFFLGIVQVGLGRMIQNKAVTVSLATMLALGAAAMEPVFGFTLRAFGPVALGVFLLISSMLVYRTLRAFEVHKLGAGLVVLVLLYLGLAAFLPAVNHALLQTTPVLPLIIVVLLAILITKYSESTPFRQLNPLPREIVRDAPGLVEEEMLVRQFLTENKHAKKDEQSLLAELAELVELLNKVGTVPEARSMLAQHFKQLLHRVHPLEESIERIETLEEQVERVDLKLFADLKGIYPKLEPKEQRAVRAEIKQAMAKLGIEKQLKELARRVRQHVTSLREHLDKAQQLLADADLAGANERVHLAISREQMAAALFRNITELEEALLGLTTRELKSLPE